MKFKAPQCSSSTELLENCLTYQLSSCHELPFDFDTDSTLSILARVEVECYYSQKTFCFS